jgi:hypothetical protein
MRNNRRCPVTHACGQSESPISESWNQGFANRMGAGFVGKVQLHRFDALKRLRMPGESWKEEQNQPVNFLRVLPRLICAFGADEHQ